MADLALPCTHILTMRGCAPCDYVKQVLGALPGLTFVEAGDLPKVVARAHLRAVLDGLRSDRGGLRMPAWLRLDAEGRLEAFGPVVVGITFPEE